MVCAPSSTSPTPWAPPRPATTSTPGVPDELNASGDPAAGKNRFAFTGYQWDPETGLYNAKARYFDPNLGRFLSQDSYLGQIDRPPSLHRYTYASDNPTTRIDLTGFYDADANALAKALGRTGIYGLNRAANQVATRSPRG
jgi:RHS repeat-associated protein